MGNATRETFRFRRICSLAGLCGSGSLVRNHALKPSTRTGFYLNASQGRMGLWNGLGISVHRHGFHLQENEEENGKVIGNFCSWNVDGDIPKEGGRDIKGEFLRNQC